MTNKSVFSSVWQAICIVTLFSWLSLPAFSGELLYSLSTQQGGSGVATVYFNIYSTSQLVQDSVVDVILPSGQTVSGVVKRTLTGVGRSDDIGPKETSRTIVSFEDNAGALELLAVNNTIAGMILHDAVNRKIYRAVIDGNGRGVLREENVDGYQCVDFPIAPDTSVVNIPDSDDLIPDVSTLQNLESRPGAAKTLYINYWGGTLSDTAWNDNYNSGNDITYTPYSYDSDTTTFSSTDRYLMWLGWQEAAEDYAAFDINVTTKQAVYDATAIVNRSQMIATRTNYFYPGAGGVAYLGIFNNTSDYYKTAWTWNNNGGSLGMTISHEAGHQMGLRHDGTSTREYYRGHGVWGPIMGAPFYQAYVQWSKGGYPDANRSENDLTIVATVLGAVIDDAGDSTATATGLSLPVTDHEGQITPNGLFADVDVYSFSASGTTHVEVKPLLGAEGENRAANLAMNVTLQNSSGSVIASMTSSDNYPLAPTTNTLVYDGTLAADTYYILIDAVSPDTNWATGFDEYGNEGEYRLTISGGSNNETLTVNKSGTGSGTVTSSPLGIDCGTDCSEDYDFGTEVTLTATPDAGSIFTGWSGSCSGASCSVTMDTDHSVNANFVLQTGSICDTVTEIPSTECEALVAFYNSTDGDNWWDNTGWNVTNTPCNWYGVSCSGGHVSKLSLSSNQLNGAIPTELGQLSRLKKLFLDFNQLSGPIPAELSDLINLEDIRLSANQLSGPIPPELGNLIKLKRLYLYKNQLCGKIPEALMNLTALYDPPWGLILKDNNLINDDAAYSPEFIAWLDQMAPDWRNQVSPSYCSSSLLQFSETNYNVNEGDGLATITVTRSGEGAVSVEYATSDDSATAPDDYTQTSGTLNWSDGDDADKTFTVAIIDDSDQENDENFIVSLANPTGGAELGTPDTAAVTITDNESAFSCQKVTEIPTKECKALVALYDSTDGENWVGNTGWKVTNSPCNWYGVSCQGGKVTELALGNNSLKGSISKKLSKLKKLKILLLNDNNLSGKLSKSLMKLKKLTELDLNNNCFSTKVSKKLRKWLDEINPGWDETQTGCL
jgi:Leucine-rich repeat (LRR) protein